MKKAEGRIGWAGLFFILHSAFFLLPSSLGQGFEFGNYQVVSSARVGRTEFEYVMRVVVTNRVAAAQGVSAEVFSRSADTVVVEGHVDFGDLGLGQSGAGSDTFTIRQNRLVAFNPTNLQWFVTVQAMALGVSVTSPASGLLTNGTSVLVSGSVGGAVDGVRVGGVLASLTGSNFTAVALLEEGRNTITVLATNTYGGAGTVNVIVNRDTTPPILSIDTPTNGSVLAGRQVTVSGQINDIVPGTVNPEQATVMVNGLAATILNRSYAITEVLLAPGRNTIMAVGTDRAGNQSQRQIEVTFQDPASQKRLRSLAGNGQIGMIGKVLPDPLVVELVDGDGVVQTNQPVTFAVSRNDGVLLAAPDSGRSLTVLSDDKGQARVQFQLGSRSGVGNNEVAVSSAGVAIPLLLSASATGAPPANVAALIPETQVGQVSQPLPLPWTAFVTDAGGNPVAGAPVSFSVTQGGGNIGGATSVITNSDSDGRAFVLHTLGAEEGVNNHIVTATVAGLSNSAAVFSASGQAAGPANQTRLIGVVLDNANRPMSNILCRIENTLLVTVSDPQGQFVLSNAPVGAVRLNVDARNRGYPGEWHTLQFDLVTVAGQDNQLDRPIYLLPLDAANSALAGGGSDVTLHLAGVPGSSLTILAHSLRDNNNQPITNRVMWTQVNLERVPMAPPIGSQFTLAWTVQPINLRFNPPARVCVPNKGFAPGQVLEMFGFDHDINAFVSLGQGTVSADGAQICSNPGFGITKSGWGGAAPPPPPKNCLPKCPDPKEDDCTRTTYQLVIDDAANCVYHCVPTEVKKPPQGGACTTANVTTSYPEHLNSGHQVVPATAFASTLPHYSDTKVETMVCLDGNTFRVRVTSATSPVDIDEHATLQGRQNCDTVPVTATNYCTIVDDLDDQDYSHIPCISKDCNLAHERAHKKEWEDNWNARFPALKQSLEALSVPASDTLCTAAKAKAQLQAQIDALVQAAVAAGQAQWNGEGEGVNGEAAEDACNAGKIMGICATAKAAGFPACALCPP